jgi:Homeodomain-like domain
LGNIVFISPGGRINHEQVRKMRFEAIYEYRESSRLPVEEIAEMLGIDEYTFRHEYELYEVEELERSIDCQSEHASARLTSVDKVMELLELH